MINTTDTKINRPTVRRKTNRITLALTFIFIISFLLLLSTFGNVNAYGDGETEFMTITVEAGDSLWSIAEANTPEHIDLRETMSLIVKYNELKSELILIGDQLQVPKLY